MSSQAERLLKFIEESPSCFHVVENVKKTADCSRIRGIERKRSMGSERRKKLFCNAE